MPRSARCDVSWRQGDAAWAARTHALPGRHQALGRLAQVHEPPDALREGAEERQLLDVRVAADRALIPWVGALRARRLAVVCSCGGLTAEELPLLRFDPWDWWAPFSQAL